MAASGERAVAAFTRADLDHILSTYPRDDLQKVVSDRHNIVHVPHNPDLLLRWKSLARLVQKSWSMRQLSPEGAVDYHKTRLEVFREQGIRIPAFRSFVVQSSPHYDQAMVYQVVEFDDGLRAIDQRSQADTDIRCKLWGNVIEAHLALRSTGIPYPYDLGNLWQYKTDVETASSLTLLDIEPWSTDNFRECVSPLDWPYDPREAREAELHEQANQLYKAS